MNKKKRKLLPIQCIYTMKLKFQRSELLLQILMYHHYALAFVMTRGSIPVHWSQPGYKYRPPPRLDRTEEEDGAAFAKHFDQQLSTYNGQVVAVSLSEKQGREKVIN